ncbi:MAG: PEP-CTERM sorting domain-containing protein [Burkholderiaceae bacterium]|nr:PEP-CTERM sorting domain-containing protein [Burkholderiaceae bacterium]
MKSSWSLKDAASATVFEDGIGNAPVPEPASFVLLAAGLLVLAAALPRARAAKKPA